MWARLSVLVVVVAGCVNSDAVSCGDGTLCPASTQCRQLTNPAQQICATDDQIQRCVGKAELDDCSTAGDASERCYDGVCLHAGCGNGRLDPGEVCDDGNDVIGDGCSDACMSNETCGNGIVDPVKLDGSGHPIPNEQCDDGNRLSHDGCASDCQTEVAQWEQLQVGPPSAREDGRAVFDAARRRIVVFGGGVPVGALAVADGLGDTWEWDGTSWTQAVTTQSPPARIGAAVAYDVARRQVVVFGGAAAVSSTYGGTSFHDTWEYDGTQWVEHTTSTRPAARYDAGAAYDTKRHVMVMFGGTANDGSALGDTWEYDGTDWKPITVTPSPPARHYAAMAFDPKRAVIVMAGSDATDTWEYDGTWHDVTPTAKSDLLSQFQLTYDPALKKVLGFGGTTTTSATTLNTNTWSWDGTSWQKVATTGISARAGTMLVGDPLRGNTVAFGGYIYKTCGAFSCRTPQNDTYLWTGAWTPATLAVPAGRGFGASALDTDRGVLVFFGGDTFTSATGFVLENETWELAAGHWTQLSPSTPPSLRDSPAMAFDAARHQSVLFGGADPNDVNYYADTNLWNGSQWITVTPQTSPPARREAAMAYDPVRQRVVLFGGSNGTFPSFADTWEWDGTNWKLAATTGPAPRYSPVMTWDPHRQKIVLTAGQEGGAGAAVYRDTWEWDGTTWTAMDNANTTTPGSRTNTSVAWNGPRSTLALFGGALLAPLGDTWEWSGTTWDFLHPLVSPAARSGQFSSSSLDGTGVIIFGGFDNTLNPSVMYGDIWRLRWTSGDRYEACSLADLDSDGDGLAGCADPDCWARCTPMCPPGTTCDPSWPHCGDGTCSSVEDCRLCPTDCGACTAVCGDGFCDAGETNCPGDCP